MFLQKLSLILQCDYSIPELSQKNKASEIFRGQSIYHSRLIIHVHTNIVTGFSRYFLNVCKKAAPTAPSTLLWSQLRVTFITLLTPNPSPFFTTTSLILPTAIIAL